MLSHRLVKAIRKYASRSAATASLTVLSPHSPFNSEVQPGSAGVRNLTVNIAFPGRRPAYCPRVDEPRLGEDRDTPDTRIRDVVHNLALSMRLTEVGRGSRS